MEITFTGGVRSVTGSRHLLRVNNKYHLLDCGFFQGRRAETYEKNRSFPFEPSSVDSVVLSHAHIDHSANIPNLVRQGFKGKIYATSATCDLCGAMLKDSAMIQETDARYMTRKNKKKGLPAVEPIYTMEDVENTLPYFIACNYHESFSPGPGAEVTFFDAGHILGSAVTLLELKEGEYEVKLLYAVDLGRKDIPILRDPECPGEADYLILESTYGDRIRPEFESAIRELEKVVNRTVKKSGKIIIPAFAVERTQTLIYCLHKLSYEGRIPQLPVYVDSPLAVNVTDIFRSHPEYFDAETRGLIAQDDDPFGFAGLTYTRSVEESKALNEVTGPCIIISASGMCENGRILHHLANNIENPKNTILIVGFMANNTLGRRIVDHTETVRIFGEEYHPRAEVVTIGAFSAHADQAALVEYAEHLGKNLKGIFVVHGEEQQSLALASSLKQDGFKNVIVPEIGDTVSL